MLIEMQVGHGCRPISDRLDTELLLDTVYHKMYYTFDIGLLQVIMMLILWFHSRHLSKL